MKPLNNLKIRSLTAAGLIAYLVVMLYFGGVVFALGASLCLFAAVYEELKALQAAGHQPIWWPSFSCLGVFLLMVVLIVLGVVEIHPMAVLLPLMTLSLFAVLLLIMRRKAPELMDITVSTMPILSIVIPGCCMLSILTLDKAQSVQNLLLALCFTISVGGDTLAYFAGSLIGGPKMCPAISPKKTWAGAVGGLLGSVLFALLTGYLFRLGIVKGWFGTPNPNPGLPPMWTLALCGLLGGVAGQMGDLFASLVKRHCGIKDFSNLFPGHGGMLDRLDSILFTSVIVYSFTWILF